MSDTGSLETEPLAQAGRPARSNPGRVRARERAAAHVKPAATFIIAASLADASRGRPRAAACRIGAGAAVSGILHAIRFSSSPPPGWDSPPSTATVPTIPTSSPTRRRCTAAAYRYSFDTHWGGSLDFVDYVFGRTALIIDYEALIGDEFRLFDPNQAIYTLEVSSSVRVSNDSEVVGVFHHVSRHLSDRANRQAVAWNAAGVRWLKQYRPTYDARRRRGADAGRPRERSSITTGLASRASALRHPSERSSGGVRAGRGQDVHGRRQRPNRGTQTGGVAEAGIRLGGTATWSCPRRGSNNAWMPTSCSAHLRAMGARRMVRATRVDNRMMKVHAIRASAVAASLRAGAMGAVRPPTLELHN